MQNTSHLYDLIELAKEPSSDKRRQLLRTLADAFLGAAPDLNETERNHFGAILTRLAADMDAAVRSQLSAKLAGVPTAPHELIRHLANDDDLSVSHDVLTQSVVLQEDDLIEIVRRAVQEKIELIAARETVPETVSDAIVQHGGDKAIVRLLSNEGARLSHKTMTEVVERSELNDAFQAPLAARNDVPPQLLQEMFAFFRNDLRLKIAEKLDALPPEVLEEAVAQATQELLSTARRASAADRHAKLQVVNIARQGLLNEEMLTQFLRDGRMTAFVHAFAQLCEIDVRTAHRLINNNNTQGIAIVCRAQRFDRATFAMIALHFDAKANGKTEDTQRILDLYDRVSPESAQRLMRFWRMRNAAFEAKRRLAAKES